MGFVQGDLKDGWIIEPRVFGDSRGFYLETRSKSISSSACPGGSARTGTIMSRPCCAARHRELRAAAGVGGFA